MKLENLEDPDCTGLVEFRFNGRYSTMGNLGEVLSKATVGSDLHFVNIAFGCSVESNFKVR